MLALFKWHHFEWFEIGSRKREKARINQLRKQTQNTILENEYNNIRKKSEKNKIKVNIN